MGLETSDAIEGLLVLVIVLAVSFVRVIIHVLKSLRADRKEDS